LLAEVAVVVVEIQIPAFVNRVAVAVAVAVK
jgi:hypothetical protein